MNKAAFDRKYKAIKGHMLNDIIVLDENDENDDHPGTIIDVYWSDTLNKLVIVTKN